MITATNPEKSLQIRMKNFRYGQFNEHSVMNNNDIDLNYLIFTVKLFNQKSLSFDRLTFDYHV